MIAALVEGSGVVAGEGEGEGEGEGDGAGVLSVTLWA